MCLVKGGVNNTRKKKSFSRYKSETFNETETLNKTFCHITFMVCTLLLHLSLVTVKY